MFCSYGCCSKLLHLTVGFNLIIWTGSPFQTICSVIAAVQHYLYISLYTWMLTEAFRQFFRRLTPLKPLHNGTCALIHCKPL